MNFIIRREVFAIKTLIELLDSCQIENVVAGIHFVPEKIVFVGFQDAAVEKQLEDLRHFFKTRKLDIALEFKFVKRDDFDGICNVLNGIIDANADCCFDLTGGKELVLTAMGAVSALRNIPMIQFNIPDGKLIRVKNCENIPDVRKATMTINESIVLNGGTIVKNVSNDYNWDFNKEFCKDIEAMWESCRKDCALWNRQSMVFASIEKHGFVDGLRIITDLKAMKSSKLDTLLHDRIIKELIKNGILLDYSLKNDIVSYRYKSEQVRRCLAKAGNLLELYVFKTLKEISENEPGFYDDMDIGVYIDWDGIVHEGNKGKDTRNEIDVIAMRDLIPIYISCKNGEVKKDALYEIAAVAEHFGGDYAKKVLITTFLTTDEKGKGYRLQRGKDMGITVIDGVEKMDKEKFYSVIKNSII